MWAKNSFPSFLAQSQILINLLPLTEENTGILSAELFQQLPEQSALIHVGRGQHLNRAGFIGCTGFWPSTWCDC